MYQEIADNRKRNLTFEELRQFISRDESTQRLIGHFAEEIYNERMFFKKEGDSLSDWINAEDKYIRIFMRRRVDDHT